MSASLFSRCASIYPRCAQVCAILGCCLISPASADSYKNMLATHPLVVEIVATPGATLLDFAGPAEVFGVLTGHAVEYVVSDDTKPFRLENGVVVAPDYTFDQAPKPDVVIIGSQAAKGGDQAMAWLKRIHAQGGTVMSVCTGANWLAQSGLLDGLEATTHSDAIKS